jgi:cephalosporin hydroxylase
MLMNTEKMLVVKQIAENSVNLVARVNTSTGAREVGIGFVVDGALQSYFPATEELSQFNKFNPKPELTPQIQVAPILMEKLREVREDVSAIILQAHDAVEHTNTKLDWQAFIDEFTKFYYSPPRNYRSIGVVEWMGVQVHKNPFDMLLYQEILFETKPDLIIEIGTADGGSALYLAGICDILQHGEIISIDIRKFKVPGHKRIQYMIGDSVSPKTIQAVEKNCKNKRVMVILDGNHAKDHVLKELLLYSSLVSKGCYLVVEDTAVNGHPILPCFGPGPYEAVQEFMSKAVNRKDFMVDKKRDHYAFTYNPGGYLKRI